MKRLSAFRRYLFLGIALFLAFAGIFQLTRLTPPVDMTKAGDLNLTEYVNSFIGTSSGGSSFGFSGDSGDTFPGATYPMGMLQWSPDTTSNLPGGYYYPDTTIKGFSLTHFSGRGCRVYQDIPFMPFDGNATTRLWLPWNSVRNGTTLNFTSGSIATNWGSGPGDAPPSYSAS